MKQNRFTSYGAVAALVLLAASCDEGMDFGSGTGTISPSVSYDPTVVASRSAGSRVAEFDQLTVDDLTITLTSADGKFSGEYTVANFPTDHAFAIGKYTMTASYGNPDEEGFGKPAVYGSTELTVSEGKTTQVELVAKPSKAMVGITFDESVTSYMTDLSATIHSAGGQYISYAADETRFAYLKPGRVTVDVTFTKPNGKGGTIEVANFEAQAQHRYKLGVKLGGDGSGEVESITITYDETLAQESVDIDISDEILTVPAPEVTVSGFTPGEVINVVEGSGIAGQLRYAINARGGIRSAVLTTTGTSLLDLGWPAEIDLANATAQQQQQLTDLGFKDLGILRNPGKMAAFELTDVVKHIPATVEGASPVMFSLMVTDKNGKTSGEQPVGFGVKVDRLALTLHPVEGYAYAGEPTVDVLVDYNGTEPLQNLLTVKYLNNNGVFKDATIADVAVQSRATQTYVVKVNVPSDAKLPVVLKASAGSVTTGEVTIPNASAPVLTVKDNDVFARSAWVNVSSSDYDCSTKTIELYVSADGASFTKAAGSQSGADYHITGGLNPGTSYTLRAKVGALTSNMVTITTEAATQLENSDMETWTTTEIKNGAYPHTKHIPGGPWATLNDLTTSQPNAVNNRSMNNAVEYVDGGHIGKAASVRTVGWQLDGTFLTGYKQPKNTTTGELFLGTYSYPGGANYGIAFASRPSALTFWYKYNQFKDGDRGAVSVEVLDAAGNVLASGAETYGAADSFQNARIVLTYARDAAKAAQLRVKFSSLDRVATGDDVESIGASTTAKATGASFYIDDIELVY